MPLWITRYFDQRLALNEAEKSALECLVGIPKTLRRGDTLRHEGDASPQIYALKSGWVTSSISLPDGGRQIIRVSFPGHLIGIANIGLVEAADTLQAATDIEFSSFDREVLKPIFSDHPRLAALFFLMSQHERIDFFDQMVSIGRTSAESRICAMILRFRSRLRGIDPAVTSQIPFYLTQLEVADMLGMTPVHVNRMLRRLTESGIISRGRHWLRIEDEQALARLAQLPKRTFDNGWLPQPESGSGKPVGGPVLHAATGTARSS